MKKMRSRVGLTGLIVLLAVFLMSTYIFSEDILKVGIIQIVEHPALDSASEGFRDVLEENGYIEGENIIYDYQNAQGDMSIANTIANKFAWEKPDLILAIATPTAQAVANTIKDIPILITAVTDPVAAELIETMEKPNTNVTGTTDMTPVAKQIELLLKLKPEAKNIGILYNAGEVNSVVQVEIAKEVCLELGLNLVEATADNSSSVYQAAQSLSNRVDAIYVPTDNTVVSAIESVVKIAEDYDLPLIVGEEDSVKRGGLATEGLSYYQLGRQTGEMALRIINGESPENMPIESQKQTRLVINEDAAKKMGVVIPEELKEIADEII
jgi:putative tryptophan/tyrosine transport system substrate-binding protein